MTDYKIGQAQIRKLIIKSNINNGTNQNISNLATKLFFYEDIFANHMTSEIEILDGTSLLTTLPIVGGEVVEMDVGELGAENKEIRKLKTNFVTFKMSSRQRPKPDLEFYVLSLATAEQLIDSSITIDRSYTKEIHNIIKDVVNEFLTPISGKKLISFEETKGIHDIIATGITPMAFIKQLVREAESSDNPSSLYMFYETVEGYHFETLDGLYSKDIQHKFIYDEITKSSATPGASNLLQINIAYLNVDNSFNLLDGQIDGQFASEVYSFDPLTKSFITRSYSYTEFEQNKNSNRTIGNAIMQKYMANPTTSRFIVTNSHRTDVQYVTQNEDRTQNIFRRRQDFMALERATLRQYGSMRLHASVPGNSNVIAGQTIELIIPSPDDTVEGKVKNDRFITGKYIVTAVAHNINVATGEYATVMECMRPGYQSRIT